ncbi:unnamed protein product [Bursaphelenchus okinawaensis]|uniref:[histone H3]-lysine(4) N-trimethyltransferase n=1 Tax=Bursaphelenchus okinawaensis TaxID=465554 RepID=A0A811KD05_9BILA|nr:unnamed protein product [Bursaphelenchus okinawaensis]CAG9101965.1 unnamed protein product [Bursaphelenchus okinawaensis]
MSQNNSFYPSHGCEPSTSFHSELTYSATDRLTTSFSSYTSKYTVASTRSSDTTIRKGPSTPPPEEEEGTVSPLPWRRLLGRIEVCKDAESRSQYKQLLERYGNHNFSERKHRAIHQGKDLYEDFATTYKEPEREWQLIESRIFGNKPKKYSFLNIMVKDSKGNLKATKRVNGVCMEYPEFTKEEVHDPRGPPNAQRFVIREYSEVDVVIDNNYCAAPPRREVCITNLNDNVREEYLLSICSKFGHVNYLHIYTNPDPKVRKHLGFALLEFTCEEDAMSFVKHYTETPTIMGFPVKVFIDTLGFWATEEYKKVTKFDAPLPPRHANLTDVIATARLRHLVKLVNAEDGIIDSREALEPNHVSSNGDGKKGCHTPPEPPSTKKGPKTPEFAERKRSSSQNSSNTFDSLSPGPRRYKDRSRSDKYDKYSYKNDKYSKYDDRKRRRSLSSASDGSSSDNARYSRRKSGRYDDRESGSQRKRVSRFDRMNVTQSPMNPVKQEPDQPLSQPVPQLIKPTIKPHSQEKEHDYSDYILKQDGVFWDATSAFVWRDYPLQYFNRYADAAEQAKVIEYGWQQHEGDVTRFPTCYIDLGYAYYTTKLKYPQPPVDTMKENIDLAKQSLKTEMLFHLTQAVGQIIEHKLYLEMEKMHNAYDAEVKKREAEKAKQKVQLKQFDLEAYLEGQSRRQSVFGSVSFNKNNVVSKKRDDKKNKHSKRGHVTINGKKRAILSDSEDFSDDDAKSISSISSSNIRRSPTPEERDYMNVKTEVDENIPKSPINSDDSATEDKASIPLVSTLEVTKDDCNNAAQLQKVKNSDGALQKVVDDSDSDESLILKTSKKKKLNKEVTVLSTTSEEEESSDSDSDEDSDSSSTSSSSSEPRMCTIEDAARAFEESRKKSVPWRIEPAKEAASTSDTKKKEEVNVEIKKEKKEEVNVFLQGSDRIIRRVDYCENDSSGDDESDWEDSDKKKKPKAKKKASPRNDDSDEEVVVQKPKAKKNQKDSKKADVKPKADTKQKADAKQKNDTKQKANGKKKAAKAPKSTPATPSLPRKNSETTRSPRENSEGPTSPMNTSEAVRSPKKAFETVKSPKNTPESPRSPIKTSEASQSLKNTSEASQSPKKTPKHVESPLKYTIDSESLSLPPSSEYDKTYQPTTQESSMSSSEEASQKSSDEADSQTSEPNQAGGVYSALPGTKPPEPIDSSSVESSDDESWTEHLSGSEADKSKSHTPKPQTPKNSALTEPLISKEELLKQLQQKLKEKQQELSLQKEEHKPVIYDPMPRAWLQVPVQEKRRSIDEKFYQKRVVELKPKDNKFANVKFPKRSNEQEKELLYKAIDEEDAMYVANVAQEHRYHFQVGHEEQRHELFFANPFTYNRVDDESESEKKKPRRKEELTCARIRAYVRGQAKKHVLPAREQGALEITERDERAARNRQERSRELKLLQRGLYSSIGDRSLVRSNNMFFRHKQLKFARSRIHGWGLFAVEDVQPHELIIEYVGEMVRSTVADAREVGYTKRGIGSSYLFRLDSDFVIDATKSGNVARFINHSCSPNCYAKILNVGTQKKICIYGKRFISKGEEITYDYKFPFEEEKIVCFCGADNCRGSLN